MIPNQNVSTPIKELLNTININKINSFSLAICSLDILKAFASTTIKNESDGEGRHYSSRKSSTASLGKPTFYFEQCCQGWVDGS